VSEPDPPLIGRHPVLELLRAELLIGTGIDPRIRRLAVAALLEALDQVAEPAAEHTSRARSAEESAQVSEHAALAGLLIVSSGGTMIACARALTAAGATTIDAVVTHALFPEQLCREMTSSGIRSIRSTYSVSHSTNAIALDDLFVDALKGELTRADTSESCR